MHHLVHIFPTQNFRAGLHLNLEWVGELRQNSLGSNRCVRSLAESPEQGAELLAAVVRQVGLALVIVLTRDDIAQAQGLAASTDRSATRRAPQSMGGVLQMRSLAVVRGLLDCSDGLPAQPILRASVNSIDPG